MKRRPVRKGAAQAARYPGVHDPEFRALVKKLAAATASIGAAGVIGLGLPACSSTASKDAVEQKDTFDSYGNDATLGVMPFDIGEDLSAPDTDAEAWATPGEDGGDPLPDALPLDVDTGTDVATDPDAERWELMGIWIDPDVNLDVEADDAPETTTSPDTIHE